MRKRALILGLTALFGGVGTGCGGDGNDETGDTGVVDTAKSRRTTPATTINLAAPDDGSLKFDKDVVQTQAGTLQLILTNPSSTPHNVAVKGNGVDEKGKVVKDGGRSQVTVTLKPGRYEFYCSVAGHEAAGMKGTLEVGNTAGE